MAKQISVSLNEQATQIIEQYITDNGCTRNKAINDLIVGSTTPTQAELMKYIKAIYKNTKK